MTSRPFTVINEELVRNCIRLENEEPDDEDKRFGMLKHKKREIEFHEITWLQFSFKSLLHFFVIFSFLIVSDRYLQNIKLAGFSPIANTPAR